MGCDVHRNKTPSSTKGGEIIDS